MILDIDIFTGFRGIKLGHLETESMSASKGNHQLKMNLLYSMKKTGKYS
jgi:hypothetical protein